MPVFKLPTLSNLYTAILKEMYLYGRHEYTINQKDHTVIPGFALFLETVNDILYWELIYFRRKFSYFVLEKINLVL